jgi:hypothetical protein
MQYAGVQLTTRVQSASGNDARRSGSRIGAAAAACAADAQPHTHLVHLHRACILQMILACHVQREHRACDGKRDLALHSGRSAQSNLFSVHFENSGSLSNDLERPQLTKGPKYASCPGWTSECRAACQQCVGDGTCLRRCSILSGALLLCRAVKLTTFPKCIARHMPTHAQDKGLAMRYERWV